MSVKDRKSNLNLAQIYSCLGKTHGTEVIENILKHDVDIDYRVPPNCPWSYNKAESLGSTALHLAFDKNDHKSYKLLLNCGADFTIKDNKGFTPLHRVITKLRKDSKDFWVDVSNNEFINSTLAAHVKTENFCNPCNSDGLSHFHIACMSNNIEAVEFFLKNEVAINDTVNSESAKFAGWTPLHFAVKSYSSELVKVLLTKNANRFLKHSNHMTPSDLLVKRKIKLIQSLNTIGEKNYSTEKVKVEIDKIEEILQLLVQFNLEKKETIDESIFHAICSLKDSSVCESFQDYLPSPNYREGKTSTSWTGLTACHIAAYCNIEIFKLLMSKNFNMTAQSASVVTPVEIFLYHQRIEDVHAFLNLVPKYKDVVFNYSDNGLLDLILTLRDPDEFNAYLRSNVTNINVPISKKSPLFQGYTPLHLAVWFSERFKTDEDPLTLVELCLKRGADVTIQNYRGETPIHMAYLQNKKKIVELLLNRLRVLINPVDDNGLSHLHIACAQKNVRLVRDLADRVDVNVAYKKRVNIPYKLIKLGFMPLHIAVGSGCLEIVEALIKGGADVNARDGDGWTPIHRAFVSSESKKIIDLLLSQPNLENRVIDTLELSNLHIACSVDNVDAVDKLIGLGANIDARIIYGDDPTKASNLKTFLKPLANFTPLDIAMKEKSSKTVDLLLQRGADMLTKRPDGAIMLIDVLTSKDKKDYEDKFLSKLWSDKELQQRLETEAGISMLHIACRTFNVEAIAELLKTQVDINLQVPANSHYWAGKTPLHLFLYKAYVDSMENIEPTLRMLLDKGASVTITDVHGSSPILSYASNAHDRNLHRLLLDHQRDFTLNPTSANGTSHFHLAIMAGHVEVVKKFLEAGNVDVNQPIDMFNPGNIAGSSPLDLAIFTRSREIHGLESQLELVELLLKHKADPCVEDAFGATPLHTIAKFGPSRLELFEKFATLGAYGNYRNAAGRTPFEELLKSLDIAVEEIEFFLKHGSQVNSFNPVSGEGYMSLLISKDYHTQRQEKALDKVIAAAEECLRDENGRTVIHNIVACSVVLITVERYVELIDQFMKLGVDIDEQDESGKTALHIAAYFGNKEATVALLRTGADINIVDADKKSAFSYAIESKVKSANRQDLIKHLANHVYKLQYLKIDLSQLNENLLKDNEPNVDPSFTEQLNACSDVERYSFVLKDFLSETGTVASYCSMMPWERVKVDQFFKSFPNNDELIQLKDVLQLQYRKAVARLRLNGPSVQILRSSFEWRLPDLYCRGIVRCLSNSNLKELMEKVTSDDEDNCIPMDID